MADVQILAAGGHTAPLDYVLNNLTELIPKAIRADYDGSAAVTAFEPCLILISATGDEIARIPCGSVAAGGSATCSWFPRVGGGGGSGTYEHNAVAVGSEPALNFQDAGGVTWGVTDVSGTRVDVKLTSLPGIPQGVVTAPAPEQLGLAAEQNAGGSFGSAVEHDGFRVIVPKTGTLHDMSIFVHTAGGNVEVAILDTSAGTRNILYASGYVPVVGANQWQVVADPNLPVSIGDHIDFSISFSSNVGLSVAWFTANLLASTQTLPANFLPSPLGGQPIMLWTDVTSPRPYGATTTVPEANLGVGGSSPVCIARIVT